MRLMVLARPSSSLILIFFSSCHEKLSSSARFDLVALLGDLVLFDGIGHVLGQRLTHRMFLSFWSRSISTMAISS